MAGRERLDARSARSWELIVVALAAFGAGTTPFAGGSAATAAAAVTAVKGSACGYVTNVGLFGGPQNLRGCGQPSGAPAAAASPLVTLPGGGSADPVTDTDADGASAEYGPAVIFGGKWPADVQTAPPSGPIRVSTQGTPAGGSVTSSAEIALHPTPRPVRCEPNPTPPVPRPAPGQVCTAPGGFGPLPVEGDELHVTCSASESAVTGSTRFVNAVLTTSTDAEGEPKDQEPVPDNPAVNYTRSGIITNVGDVFTVVYNEQIPNADGSLTVNAVHMYLFGPTAVGEVIKGQATCGVTPSPLSTSDKAPPSCGTLVVAPVGPEDPTPKVPRTEVIGVFDTGGLQSITNVQATNATVQVGDPTSSQPYLKLNPGQTGPVPVTATRTDESKPMSWSFDATDKAGNVTRSSQCPTNSTRGASAAPATSSGTSSATSSTVAGTTQTTTSSSGAATTTGASAAATSTATTVSAATAGLGKTGGDPLPWVLFADAMAVGGLILLILTRPRPVE